MTDPSIISQRQREFEKQANDRFHEHGKHISRIEGIMEERTRNLREANAELRDEVRAMGDKIEKVEERLTGKIDGLGVTVGNLSTSIVRQGVYIGIGAALGAGIFTAVLREVISKV